MFDRKRGLAAETGAIVIFLMAMSVLVFVIIFSGIISNAKDYQKFRISIKELNIIQDLDAFLSMPSVPNSNSFQTLPSSLLTQNSSTNSMRRIHMPLSDAPWSWRGYLCRPFRIGR